MPCYTALSVMAIKSKVKENFRAAILGYTTNITTTEVACYSMFHYVVSFEDAQLNGACVVPASRFSTFSTSLLLVIEYFGSKAVWLIYSVVMYVPSFVKIDQLFQRLMWAYTQTHRQHGNMRSAFLGLLLLLKRR